MGKRPPATPEQRAEAVAIYADHGPTEAAKLTGWNKGTVTKWAQAAGVETVANERTRQATEAASAAWAARRARLADETGRVAEKALTKVEVFLDGEKAKAASDTSAAFARLIDKAQLLSGAATSRSEHVEKDHMDRAIEELLEKAS